MDSPNNLVSERQMQMIKPGSTELQFAQVLPLALVSLLERRYLSLFQASSWQIEPRDGDIAQPLLRQVTTLGRPQNPELWAKAMPYLLTACHDPGHALIALLHGCQNRHRLYLGGRRLIGQAARSTEDCLLAQESAFKAYYSGLEMGDLVSLDAYGLPEITTFIKSAPSMAVVTGIPSGRGGQLPSGLQSLDQLVKAIGHHSYVLMVIAEPLESWVIDQTLDACRRIKSEIHAYTRLTKTRSQGGSESTSPTEVEKSDDWISNLPSYLFGISIFCQLAGMATGTALAALSPLAKLAGPAQSMAFVAGSQRNREGHGESQQITISENWSETGGIELLDANAEACEHLLDQHIARLQSARSGGWWRTAVYMAADSEASVNSIGRAVRSLCSGEVTHLDPVRIISLPGYVLRGAIEKGQILNLFPKKGRDHDLKPGAYKSGHPLGDSFNTLSTCLNSEELAVLINLPQREIPGLPIRDRSDFALTVPPATEDSIALGILQDGLGQELGPVTITSGALNRHVFVTGITGYGKTNTCMQILIETYDKLKVPFLVIEPAKAEYRQLEGCRPLQGQVRVYTIGGDSPLPFRLNPLSPLPGIPLGRHIDLLKAVFNASFPMFAGMPYVLEEAILEVYLDRGWSIYTSQNPFLSQRASLDETSALTPCLEDLHDKIEYVLKRKKYGQEIHQNIGAALRSRLRSLMIGNKGLMLNTRRSILPEDLFGKPTVIELQNLGDDEEKAFAMALLLAWFKKSRFRVTPGRGVVVAHKKG